MTVDGHRLDSHLQWEDATDDGYLRAVKWLGVVFCGIWVQSFSISFFIPPHMGHKNISKTQQRKKRKRRRENNVCGPKQIPGRGPTRAGSRPLNQRHCLEGAPIKEILKECFIHNTSRCYFVPSSGVIDFLQVISLQCLVHYTVHFVVQLCDAFGDLKSY